MDYGKVIDSGILDHWSFGDTIVTLVGNKEFLYVIKSYDELITDEKFWHIVPEDCYINLEG